MNSLDLSHYRDSQKVERKKKNEHPPSLKDDAQLKAKLSNLFSFLEDLNNQIYQRSLLNLVNKCKTEGVEYLLNITQLDLSHCGLEAIPEEVGLLKNLEELTLIDNKLSDLPMSLASLSSLTKVEIETNQFEVIPRVIHEIATQKIKGKEYFELYLRDNPMKSVPKALDPVVRSMPHFGSTLE